MRALLACGSTEQDDLNAMKRKARNRLLPMKVFVTDDERSRIEERAKAASLSISAYLRAAGLGQPIRSTLDYDAAMALAKVNGDQGRLGGLLKLWLVDRPGRGVPEIEVRRLLERIGEFQGRLAEVVGRV
jgi:Mobilization protein NikA